MNHFTRFLIALFLLQSSQISPFWPTENKGYLTLPEQMEQEFTHIKLMHLKSVRQEGDSCGWYALFNAVAIQYLFDKNMKINAALIKRVVKEKLFPWASQQESSLRQLLKVEQLYEGLYLYASQSLADQFKLSNYYAVYLENNTNWLMLYLPTVSNELSPYVNPVQAYRNCYPIKSPLQFFKKIISQRKPIHFLLSAPAEFGDASQHAVLVTVLFDATKSKPTVIYMDSNNRLLSDIHDFWILPAAMYQFFKVLNEAAA